MAIGAVLGPSDLVQEGELLHIRRQWDLNVEGEDKFRPPKGKKSRYVPCNEQLSEEIQRLIAAREWGARMTLFHTRNGTPISHDNFDDDFRKDIKEAKVKEIRFHDFRHTGTTLMLAEGLDIKTVQDIWDTRISRLR